jgi:hypothetical protein
MNKFLISLIKPRIYRRFIPLAMLGVLALPGHASAQYFSAGNGDMVAGFRKTGANQGSYELVVKLGSIANFLAMPAGTSTPINNYSASQLSAAFSDYNNLQWSVSGMVSGGPGFYWSGFYQSTIWYTLPRPAAITQTVPLARQSVTTQGTTKGKISGFIGGANTLSSSQGSTNVNNNSVLVREKIASANSYDYAFFVQNSPQNPVLGDFSGTMPATVENTTPASFSSPVISDLYQSVPQLYADPTTGTNNGLAYYVGYFTLNPDGTMTFTRASAVTAPPPAPTITAITRTGDTANISFTTTSGSFTYSLYYTNSAGLTASTTNWPHSTSVIGDGSVKTLSDTTTDANRFYRIGAQ